MYISIHILTPILYSSLMSEMAKQKQKKVNSCILITYKMFVGAKFVYLEHHFLSPVQVFKRSRPNCLLQLCSPSVHLINFYACEAM